MKRVLALLLLLTGTAIAVTTYPRKSLQAPDIGDGSTSYPVTIKSTIEAIDTDACFVDTSNVFAAGGSLDLRAADTSAPFPQSTTLPASCTAGDVWRDSDADGLAQDCFCTATDTWTCLSPDTINIVYLNPANGDVREFHIAVVPSRLISAGAHCRANCTTPAQFTIKTRAGNTISLTGGGNLTAGTGTGDTTFTTFDTSDTDRILTVGEGVTITVANTPDATQDGIVTIRLRTP